MYENKLQFITISSSYVINKTFPWGNEKKFFFIISKPLEHHLSVLSCINLKKMGSFYSAVVNVTLINEKHISFFSVGFQLRGNLAFCFPTSPKWFQRPITISSVVPETLVKQPFQGAYSLSLIFLFKVCFTSRCKRAALNCHSICLFR